MNATEALNKLKEGNQRYLKALHEGSGSTLLNRPLELVEVQKPFAVVLCCSDARVPTELVMDQALGELFVIRVAGNIVATSQIESVEFAVAQLGVPLVLVMGHTGCGAVQATLGALADPSADGSALLPRIVERMKGALKPFVSAEADPLKPDNVERAVWANVDNSLQLLSSQSDLINAAAREGRIQLQGAVYSVETGRVDFAS